MQQFSPQKVWQFWKGSGWERSLYTHITYKQGSWVFMLRKVSPLTPTSKSPALSSFVLVSSGSSAGNTKAKENKPINPKNIDESSHTLFPTEA